MLHAIPGTGNSAARNIPASQCAYASGGARGLIRGAVSELSIIGWRTHWRAQMLLHQTLGRRWACGTLLSSLISEGLTRCPVNPRLIELLKQERTMAAFPSSKATCQWRCDEGNHFVLKAKRELMIEQMALQHELCRYVGFMPWLYAALCSTWSLGTKKHLVRCGTGLFWGCHILESISPFCFLTKLVYFWWAPIQTGSGARTLSAAGICLARQASSHAIWPKRGFIFRSSMHV